MDFKEVVIKLIAACMALSFIAVAEYIGAKKLIEDLKNGTD